VAAVLILAIVGGVQTQRVHDLKAELRRRGKPDYLKPRVGDAPDDDDDTFSRWP
jgi:hypothetical protein